jgi:uncharacterized Zn finger protein
MHFPILTMPTCPKCGKGNFGIKEFHVQDANFRHYAIMCTSCGCVVGTETMQDDERLNKIISKLNELNIELNDIKSSLMRHGIY